MFRPDPKKWKAGSGSDNILKTETRSGNILKPEPGSDSIIKTGSDLICKPSSRSRSDQNTRIRICNPSVQTLPVSEVDCWNDLLGRLNPQKLDESPEIKSIVLTIQHDVSNSV